MKKIKNIIILLIIVLIIIAVCVFILDKSSVQDKQLTNMQGDTTIDNIKNMGIVDNYITFFSVEEMLNNFIKSVQSKDKEGIYNLLDQTYISENKITLENILTKTSKISNYDSKARIRKMYGQENIENAVYYIHCVLEKNHKGEDYYFAIYNDKENLTYSVAQIEKENYEENIQNTNQKLEKKTIYLNECNVMPVVYLTEEERATRYFEDIIDNMLYYPEYAYDMLDKEYKSKYFPTLQEFKQHSLYLDQTNNIELSEYKIRQEEHYNIYTCIDNFGNYYIFYATSPLQYTVFLHNDENLIK